MRGQFGFVGRRLFQSGASRIRSYSGKQRPAWLEALNKESYDLVLSDQQMPLMTGIQLCEHVRQLPNYKQTPFILLTAKCMEIDVGKLKQTLGLTKALPKPFSPSELVNCIKEALATACGRSQ